MNSEREPIKSATAASTDDSLPLRKVRVDIHCKSKDEDLGAHEVGPVQGYGFSPTVNFWGTALYSCGASWRGGRADFDIFKASRDDEDACPENTCHWVARGDGVVALYGTPNRYSLEIINVLSAACQGNDIFTIRSPGSGLFPTRNTLHRTTGSPGRVCSPLVSLSFPSHFKGQKITPKF